MKLPLLLLSFLFCFPVFGQVVDSVDWSTKDFPFVKIPKTKKQDSITSYVRYWLEYNHDYNYYGIEEKYFSDNFKQRIDTIYEKVNLNAARIQWTDTLYIERIANYIDDKGNADIQYFHPNGQLKVRINYVATDKLLPDYEKGFLFADTSNLKTRVSLANGIVKYYYPSGQIEKIEEYKNGVKNGKFYWFYNDGQAAEEKEYKQNNITGEWKTWYKNGQLTSQSQYNNGQVVDTSYNWYDNGQLSKISQFENGLESGEIKEFHKNGQIKSISNFKVFENEKAEDVLIQEALEDIREELENIEIENISYDDSVYLSNYDTLAEAKKIALSEKYYEIPLGKFQYFDENGKTIVDEYFTEELGKKIRQLYALKGKRKPKAQDMKIIKKLMKLEEAMKAIEETVQTQCNKEVNFTLPFRISNGASATMCISNLKIGIPDTTKIELFPPFNKEYETFTQIVTLKNEEGDLRYLLKYSSGQVCLDYNLNCGEILQKELKKTSSMRVNSNSLYSGVTKVYHRNGQLKSESIYEKISYDERRRFHSLLLETKEYTQNGKILIEYIRDSISKKCEECASYDMRYFYDDYENILASFLTFKKNDAKWQEITFFHPNGNIKKKITKKDRKLHDWQELYNEAGVLIVKEKFEEGKSVEFIKY
jgi:antitoxin component YwqK of YwqJK toxin-antitoxin module